MWLLEWLCVMELWLNFLVKYCLFLGSLEILKEVWFHCSSQKHTSLLVDRGINSRKQQDYNEGSF